MRHRQKVERLLEEARRHGVGSNTIAPPLFRLFWAMGLHVPPPPFLGFAAAAFLMGTVFAVLFALVSGVLLWLLFWQGVPFGTLVLRMLLMAGIAGPLYGLWAAWFFRRQAERLGLPRSWKNYAPS